MVVILNYYCYLDWTYNRIHFVCNWQRLLSPVQNSCEFSGCVASFPILDTIYLAEITTEKKKKSILNCCQFWSQKAQRGKQFHVWRLAMRHFTSQGPSLREYWAKWSIPRRKRGLKTAIIYVIVSLEFSIRTDFQTVILSFLASSLPHPLTPSFLWCSYSGSTLYSPIPIFHF